LRTALYAGIVLAALALVLVVLIAGSIPPFDRPDSENRLVPAVAGLLGILLTQTVVVLGLAVRHSTEAADANRREVETTLRAVELLGSGSLEKTDGVLIALENLGHLDFALTLLTDLWARNLVSRRTALHLVGTALQVSETEELDEDLATSAATILLDNASKLRKDSWPHIEFPVFYADRLPREALDSLCLALAYALVSMPIENRDGILDMINRLHAVMSIEGAGHEDDDIPWNAAVFILAALPALGDYGDLELLEIASGERTRLADVEEMAREIAERFDEPLPLTATADAVHRIETWLQTNSG
jgi:hypothetical protein